jgi:hypothetical protein
MRPVRLEPGERSSREERVRRYLLCAIAAAALALAVPGGARAQSSPSVVRIRLTREVSQRILVERGIEILHVYPDGRADLVVTDQQLAWVSSRGVLVSILERVDLAAPAVLDDHLGKYYTYGEMLAAFDSLVSAHPTLARLDTLGTSVEGRAIVAIKISDNAAVDEDEPEVLLMGCHHARELMSVDVPMRLAKYLLAGYGADPLVTGLVDSREIWIAPMINVDGHVFVEQNHSGSSVTWWRKNRRLNGGGSIGVDLNRNYGYEWGYDDVGSSPTPSSDVYRGPSAFSEPETRAVRDFCAGRHFTLSVSYHSYGGLILYPWGYAPLNTISQELFSALGDTLAAGNGYLAGNAASGAIYLTNGSSDDWLYGDTTTKGVVYAFTVELNSYEDGAFAPPESLIKPTFDALLGLNLDILAYADDPYRILGPRAPVMNPIAALEPPSYRISWADADPHGPNPAASYELAELENLEIATDSVEAADTLWTPDGFTLASSRAFAGSMSYYSGRGDNLRRTLSMACIYPMWLPTTLSCRLWYDIEASWDYAYLEGSTDDGATWRTVPGDRTTNVNPYGANRGNGITGLSGGWVSATFDLRQLMVSESGFVLLRFTYITDESVNNEGIYVDLVSPVPRVERDAVIASGLAGTSYDRRPDELGEFIYWVRAFDEGGQPGRRSNLARWTVGDLAPAETPRMLSGLEQNYPNPFNPATTLAFTVGDAEAPAGGSATVGVRLYDVAGRPVAVLQEGRLAAGRYSVVWNGRGTGGRPAVSGIYFARLQIGSKVFVRKMVLLR